MDDPGVGVGGRALFLTSGRTIDASLGGPRQDGGDSGPDRVHGPMGELPWEGMELAKLLRATHSRQLPKISGF